MSPGAILDAIMQGTTRRPLAASGILGGGIAADDPMAAPQLMALAVQAQAYALPPMPAGFDETPAETDSRPIVGPQARQMIVRLVSGKGNPADDPAAFALALALDALGLRLNPFDLPRLDAFSRKHGDLLGTVASRFTGTSASSYNWFDASTLNVSNWTDAPPVRKAAFIAELRSADPIGARKLVEAQLPLESADVRVRLVDALATGLGDGDRQFLESLAGDRAPSVKQAVTRLLARLPGTGAAQAQVEELRSRITEGKAGLLRKRTTLKLQLPANLKTPPAIAEWLAAAFGSIGSSALAQAFGMDGASLLEAAQDDDALVQGIAFAACAERDWPLLSEIAQRHDTRLWTGFLQPGLVAFGLATARDKADWAAAAMPGPVDSASVDAWTLAALHQNLAGCLPAEQARHVLAAAQRSSRPSAELFTAATALTPPAGLAAARDVLNRLSPEFTARAQLLAELLICLNQESARS